MKKLMDIFDRVIEASAYLAGVLFVFMMAIISIDIILRFFVGYTFGWVVEFSGYSLLYTTFLGTAWLLREGGHIAIDVVFTHLSPKAQLYTNGVNSLVSAILCLVLIWYGAETIWDSFQSGVLTVGVLQWPEWVIIAIIPVGSLLLTIQFLRRTSSYLEQGRKKRG